MGATRSSAEEHLRERLAGLRAGRAYQHYGRVRAEVLGMKAAETHAGDRPSEYWQEELTNIEYMLDASPLVIDRLRHHTFHVTGVRPYDYRSGADKKRALLAEKLAALREIGGDDLLVPEPDLLGGFGFEIDGALFNVDTLKFYEALIALRLAGLLVQFGEPAGRPLVVEIGPGWGGFAYQFKTLFPATCYVLVDLPELFVFSAVYLMSAFPRARVAFWSNEQPLPPELLADHDFLFVPHTAFDTFRPGRVDLAVNMVSFQEMTTGQVRDYVERLHTLGCPALYSLNRDRSPYNTELTSVREIIGSRYHLAEIDVLPVSYTKLAGRAEIAAQAQGQKRHGAAEYRHVVGRLQQGVSMPHPKARSALRSDRRRRLTDLLRRARPGR